MNEGDMKNLSEILQRLTARYVKIFSTSFPYSMGIHQKPTDSENHPEWLFHMHFYPPLLRSSTIKKYYVGYEIMAEGQRDITPESAALTLKEIHD
jgi:UDPglucose--hexose-1-phosphate uridylyltransferase